MCLGGGLGLGGSSFPPNILSNKPARLGLNQ